MPVGFDLFRLPMGLPSMAHYQRLLYSLGSAVDFRGRPWCVLFRSATEVCSTISRTNTSILLYEKRLRSLFEAYDIQIS